MLACAAREQRSDVIASTIAAARAAGMPLDTPAFNTALHCHAAAGDAAAFEDTWRTMHTDGCEPNASTHAARVELLLATAEGAAARAYVQRLADLRHAAALSPSLFTTVFSGLARGGGTTYADLRALWDGMVACGVPVNSHNMSAFFKACKGLTLTAAQLAHAYDLVDGFSAAAGAPLSTYQVSTLLAVCKRSGAPGRVTDVWALCQRERVAVTPPLIVMLLACCKAAARECAAARDLAAHLGDWLRVYWLQRREARAEQPKALARTHSSMLIAFNALLAYHADVGAFEEAMAVMQARPRPRHLPDASLQCMYLRRDLAGALRGCVISALPLTSGGACSTCMSQGPSRTSSRTTRCCTAARAAARRRSRRSCWRTCAPSASRPTSSRSAPCLRRAPTRARWAARSACCALWRPRASRSTCGRARAS